MKKRHDSSFELVEMTLVEQESKDEQHSMSPDGEEEEEELDECTPEEMRINRQPEETAERILVRLTETIRVAEETGNMQDSNLDKMQARVKQINPKYGDIPLKSRSQPVKPEAKSDSTPLNQYKSTGSKSLDKKLDNISRQLVAFKSTAQHMGDQFDDENKLLTICSEKRRKMNRNQ